MASSGDASCPSKSSLLQKFVDSLIEREGGIFCLLNLLALLISYLMEWQGLAELVSKWLFYRSLDVLPKLEDRSR